MAYVVRTLEKSALPTTTAEVIPLPTHLENDVVLLFVCNNGGTTNSVTSTSGSWTQEAKDTYGDDLSCFSHVGQATPNTTATLNISSVSRYSTIAVVIRGAPTTNFVDTYAIRGNAGSQSPFVVPSVTTGTDNCLVISCAGNIGGNYAGVCENAMFLDASSIFGYQIAITAVYTIQHTAGSTGTFSFTNIRTGSNAAGITIAIKDSGAGLIETYADRASPPAVMLHRMMLEDASYLSHPTTPTANLASVSGTNVIPTIGGAATVALADSGTSAASTANNAVEKGIGIGRFYLGNGTYVNYAVCQTAVYASSMDLSDEIISIRCGFEGTRIADFNTGGLFFGISDGTNSTIYSISGRDSIPNGTAGVYPYLIQMPDASNVRTGFEHTEYGSVDVTAVDHIIFGYNAGDAYSALSSAPIYKLRTLTLLGGGSTRPASFKTALPASMTGLIGSIQTQSLQSQSQFYVTQSVKIGDGGTSDIEWDSTGEAIEFPAAYSSADVRVQAQIDSGVLGIEIDAGSGKNVNLTATTINCGDYHKFICTSGSITASGLLVLNATPTLAAIGLDTYNGLTLSGCKELTISGFTDAATKTIGAVIISTCVDDYAVTVSTQDEFEALQNCNFKNNNYSIKITGNHTGTWDGSGMTVSGGTGSYDIEYTGTSDFSIAMDTGSGWSSGRVSNTSTGTLTVVSPVETFAVSATPASAKVVIYTAGTQTVLAEGTGSASYEYPGAGNVDYTVRADGYLPVRATTVALSNSTTNVVLEEAKVYTASHGLTYGTGFSYDPATLVLTLTTDNEARNLYSCLQEYFNDHTNTAVRNKPFLLSAVGPDRIDLTKGMTVNDMQYWKGAGSLWFADGDTTNPTHGFCSIKSVGDIAAGASCYKQQTDGGTPTAVTLSGSNKIDEAIQYYSDPNHDGSTIDGYDYSDHLVFKTFADGYYQGRNDVIQAYGLTALEPYEYTLSLSNVSTGLGTGTRGLTISVTDWTATPQDPQTSGDYYDYKITEASAGAAPADILRQWVFDIASDPTATVYGKTAFNWPDPLLEVGGSYETKVGYVEGQDTTTTLHGFYVEESSDYHPDFLRFQANDSSYWTIPILAQISITGLTDGAAGHTRLQIYNVTTDTEIYSGDPAGTSYTDSYVDGVGISAGDSIRLRFTDLNDGTSFYRYSTTVVAAASGFSVSADPVADDVYATNAIDGSSTSVTTKFTPDYVNLEVDLQAASNFTAAEAYAFFCYTLTMTDGINLFWGGVTAQDTGNYRINTGTLNLYFDNLTTTNLRQTDAARIYRSDGTYPVKGGGVTTGGGGIDINWQNVVYVVSTGGSALTPAEQAQLSAIESKANSMTFTKANELDVNVQSMNGSELLGSGVEGDQWRGS